MPFVVPLPIPGGFSTELGTEQERLRALEAERNGWVYQSTSVSFNDGSNTIKFPGGWPSITYTVDDPNGVMVVWGGSIDIATQLNTFAEVFVYWTLDGAAQQSAGISPVVSATVVSPLVVTSFWMASRLTGSGTYPGVHTFGMAALMNPPHAGNTGTCYTQFLAVGPIP